LTFPEHILNLATEDLVSWAQNYGIICQHRLEILKVFFKFKSQQKTHLSKLAYDLPPKV